MFVGGTSNIEYFAQLVNKKNVKFCDKKGGWIRVLYDNVKSICIEKGITIAALERELDFPRSSIQKWNENEPGIRKVQKVADFLGVPI